MSALRLDTVIVVTLLAALSPVAVSAQGGFVAGARTIVTLDFATEPVGDVPKGLRPHFGTLDVVDKDGVHMLRASSPSDFVMHLPEDLPKNFTIEFDLIPKACCNPVDLMVEGVISGSRSSVSAQIEWDADHFAVVGGNPEMFQMDMPAAIAASLPSRRTKVALSFEDETIKMYTNGKWVYTLTNRRFMRKKILHISLGGQDEDKYAVYLASVRVADLATSIVASNAPLPNGVLVSPTTSGTITPTPTSTTTAPTPVATSPTTRTSPTVLSNAAAPTNLTAHGSPVAVWLNWDVVPGAVRYEISRAVRGTTTWTSLGTPPSYPDSPNFRDFFPDHTTTYTYRVAAFQSDGSYGLTTVDYAPPAPADPATFTAKQTGPGQVQFEWDFVPGGATKYFLTGPGTGNGIVVFAGAHMPGTKNHHTLSGIAAGTHTWTIATNWEPGGILTPNSSWPKTTATVTSASAGTHYRLVALGIKALAQSRDIDDARDGHGDEVYFSAVTNRTVLTGLPLPVTKAPNLSMVMSRTYGDQAVSVPYGREVTGTASPTGGIKSGDIVPPTLDLSAPTPPLKTNLFPLVVWDGILDDEGTVVVHPALFEDDINPIVHAMWAKLIFDEAQGGYQTPPPDVYAPTLRTADVIYRLSNSRSSASIQSIYFTDDPNSYAGVGINLFQCANRAVVISRRPCEAHGVDRPIGLRGAVYIADWAEHISVLSRRGIESALADRSTYPGWSPGTFVMKLYDQVPDLTKPGAERTEAVAAYEVYFRVERIP